MRKVKKGEERKKEVVWNDKRKRNIDDKEEFKLDYVISNPNNEE